MMYRSTLSEYFIYDDILQQIRDSHACLYTIYLIYKLLQLRARYQDPRMEFNYQQLQGYYSKRRFDVTPRGVRIPKWESVSRAVRYITYNVHPPLLEKVGKSMFRPTKEFWIFVNEHRAENGGYFWRLDFEHGSKVSR